METGRTNSFWVAFARRPKALQQSYGRTTLVVLIGGAIVTIISIGGWLWYHRLCSVWVALNGLPDGATYVDVLPVVDRGDSNCNHIWTRFYGVPGFGGWAPVEDPLSGPGVIGSDGFRLVVRRERAANRYGFVVRPRRIDGSGVDDSRARVYWISADRFETLARDGQFSLPPYEEMEHFDMGGICVPVRH
jgi:hypothetical protein